MTTTPTGTVAVTGASRGIGLATTLELARRGFRVLALVQDADMVGQTRRETVGLPVDVDVLDVCQPGDFTFPDDLTVLVNNAGARRDFLPVEHIPARDWREIFEVNVFAVAELCKRAIPALRDNGGGVICTVTSSAVLDLGPFFGAYRCSKVAASALCEQLRLELAPFHTRVIEILPGPTATVMASDGVSARVAEAVGFPRYEATARRQREVLSRQPGFTSPADVARVIADAICAENAPMRHGTDQISRQRLDQWRSVTDDEQFMTSAIARYQVQDQA